VTCAELLELAEAHAIGALDAAESAAAEEHLRSLGPHQGCQEALDRARRGWEAMALALPPARPDPRVWKGIEARIGQKAPVRVAFRERLLWVFALAAAVVLLALAESDLRKRDGFEERQRAAAARQVDTLRRELFGQREAIALLQRPASRVVPLAPQGSASQRASAILDLEGGRGVVLASALAPAAGRDYELWVIRGEAKVPAGILKPGADGTAVLPVAARLLQGGRPDALAVSIEPAGGSPQPTGPIILIGALASVR
jgi:anti-sigma-K factor RskA